MLHLSAVLPILKKIDEVTHKPTPFSIKVVKADLQRNTGGDEEFYPCAEILHSDEQDSVILHPNHPEPSSDRITKNPNHIANDTITIRLIPSRKKIKIHIPLITELNGIPVYY